MEFRNVVFNAARDGKLRRLKVRNVYSYILALSCTILQIFENKIPKKDNPTKILTL